MTGGAQMDGFVHLVRDLLIDAGIPEPNVLSKQKLEVPGYIRPEKKWDLLVVVEQQLLAASLTARAIAYPKTRT